MAFGYTGVFRTGFLSTSGANPTGIAVGDFDADGATDTAVTTGDGSQLNIHVGLFSCDGGDRDGQFCFDAVPCPGGTCKPDGTLSLVQSVQLGSFPSALIQSQFDNDAIDDLVVAQTNDDTIVFLKGLGDMDFFAEPAAPITVGRSPVGLATADIDGDGELDIVTANEGVDPAPGSITVLLGQGNGVFTLVQQEDPSEPGEVIDSLPAGGGTRAVAIGNVVGDASPDILALNATGGTISVFVGDGDGAFVPGTPLTFAPTAQPQDLALRDLNGDGDLDLITADFGEDTVSVRTGDGAGGFGAPQSYPVGTAPNRLRFGEMGGAGPADLVVSNNRSGDVSVLLGNTDGTFDPARNFFADAEPQALGLGDFNLDGQLDAVLATQGSDIGASVAVLRNRGNGVLHGVEDLPGVAGPSDLTVADLNGDGMADLLSTGGAGQVLLFGARPGGFDEPTILNIGGRTLGVAVVDMNNDVHPDIVATNIEGNSFTVLLSQGGGGRFAAPVVFDTAPGPGQITTGDFNDDGRPDVAVSAASGSGICDGGDNDGESCVRQEDCEDGGGICARPGKASVRLQQAGGTFGPVRNVDVGETPIGIASIDGNCDDRDDLLVANVASSTVSILRSNGDGSFTSSQTLSDAQVGLSPIALTVADFNRDGMDDFAVANTVAPGSSPNVRLFRGDCSGTFTSFGAGSQVRVGELPNSVVARDFTGDQLVDLAVTSQTSNQVCLLVGAGDGTLSLVGQGSCDGVSRMPIAVAAGDFDSDGRYDAASANNAATSNNLSVLFNCVRDKGCDPFPPVPPATPLPGVAALRGDGNGDGRSSAADLVRVAEEVMDGDGFQVEAVGQETDVVASAGVDANGDGRVDAQDRLAIARRIFGGA